MKNKTETQVASFHESMGQREALRLRLYEVFLFAAGLVAGIIIGLSMWWFR